MHTGVETLITLLKRREEPHDKAGEKRGVAYVDCRYHPWVCVVYNNIVYVIMGMCDRVSDSMFSFNVLQLNVLPVTVENRQDLPFEGSLYTTLSRLTRKSPV